MKIFIPYVDELRGVDAPLVPFNNHTMRVVRVEAGGEQTDAVCQVIMEFNRNNAETNIESKTRYGSFTGTGTIDI